MRMISISCIKIFVFDYVFRPNLLSLDLSYNNLVNLPNVMTTLALLPKLRNLVLQGNPLTVRSSFSEVQSPIAGIFTY